MQRLYNLTVTLGYYDTPKCHLLNMYDTVRTSDCEGTENNNLTTKTNLRKIYSFPQLYFTSSLLFDKYIESENEMKLILIHKVNDNRDSFIL